MQAALWNIGAKIADVDAEAAFVERLGGELLYRGSIATAEGDVPYVLVAFGATRLFLTPKTVFEGALDAPLQHGLTHAVFEVADVDAEVARLTELGTEMLLPLTDISAAFGKRRIAFFRSPGGIVFEVMTIVE